MRIMTGLLVLCALPVTAYAQQPCSDGKIQVLERKLDHATQQIELLRGLIELLRREISQLKGEMPPNERRPANPSDETAGQQTPAKQSSPSALVLDMYEHAYHMDYGAAAAKYVDAFGQNVNWEEVNRRAESSLKASVA